MNYTIQNPIGIDLTIQKIQNHLFEKLDWGDIEVYGRVFKNPTEKGQTLQAYVGNNEYKDVFTDDSKNGNVFFIESSEHKTKEGIQFTNKVKIVFMINLNKVYPSLGHRLDTQVQTKAIELIREIGLMDIESLDKGIDNIFNGIQIDYIKLNDMQPFHTFSISGNINYYISNTDCFK